MTTQIVERSKVGWGFWFQWVLASLGGIVVGLVPSILVAGFLLSLLSEFVKFLVGSDLGTGVYVALSLILWPALVGGMVGAVVGQLQWLVLRRHLPGAGQWVWASSLGFAIGASASLRLLEVSSFLAPNLFKALAAVMVGTPVGIVEWLVLRRRVYRASWWVLVSMLAWFPCGVLTPVSFAVAFAGDVSLSEGMAAIAALVGVLSGATIPGILLVWLLRHPIPAPVDGKVTTS